MSGTIYADLRCLQDATYRVRGIGHHVAALLRTRERSACADWKMVGLLDPQRAVLPRQYSALLSEVTYSLNPSTDGTPAIFIDGTPMTHDTRFSLRFLGDKAFFRAAVVYDFIPLDWPGYLPTVASRMDYVGKLARLKKFDLFFPISQYTAWRLSELLGIPQSRLHVTGASVRSLFYESSSRPASVDARDHRNDPYFLIVLGPDDRKNPGVAIKAVRQLNKNHGRRIALKVIGHYENYQKPSLLGLAGHAEGAGFLEFHPGIPDETLISLLSGAVAAIVPSHIEGFSLPVVEAAVCGCPVVASSCAAHLELVDHPEALFPSHDSALLAEKLQGLLSDATLRTSLADSQKHLGSRFHEEAVGMRFWSGIREAFEKHRSIAFIPKPRLPRLAFLSPYPPDQSGVARFTAMTMQAGDKMFDSYLYTDATRPLTFAGKFRDAGGVSVAPLLNGNYNAVISVIGNSHYHLRIFEFFEQYGGPCILHDARLTQIYLWRLGEERFLQLAARLLGRPVSVEELGPWSQDRTMPTPLLEPIIERAAPLIVHTRRQQAQIKQRFGVDAQVTTTCPTCFFSEDELAMTARRAARDRHGLSPEAFVVSSFGIIGPEKAADTCVLAAELLRSWHIPAELYFVGGAGVYENGIRNLAAKYHIAQHVHCRTDFVDDATYRDFLIASDAALQIRTYGFGQFSAALADCVSAGLPAVASSDLAHSCDAPPYVSTVPDRFSPLQVAEQLAVIWENRTQRASTAEARHAYLETHNFKSYAKRLLEILELA